MSRSTAAEPPAAGRRAARWNEWADRFPIRREAVLAAIAGICMVVFYLTTLKHSGLMVWVNYGSGAIGATIIGYFLAHLIPLGERGRWCAALVFAVAMVGLWGHFDHFQDRWVNEEGDKYSDWVHRWSGKVTHRTLSLKNHVKSQMVGPMAGEPECPHGRWSETTKPHSKTSDVWFWYGKRVSQAEWEAKSRH